MCVLVTVRCVTVCVCMRVNVCACCETVYLCVRASLVWQCASVCVYMCKFVC